MTIFIHTIAGTYSDFSNFSRHGITVDDLWWPTVEHYFQAQKFEDKDYQERIRMADTPKQAAELGRSRKIPIRQDWEGVKEVIMFNAILIKFQNYKKLAKLLLTLPLN